MPGRDPALRPYRIAAWATYIGLITVVVALMAVSITRTLRSPSRPSAASRVIPTREALRVCLQDLEMLFREQNRHAWVLVGDPAPKGPLTGWPAWSARWKDQVEDLADRCRLDDRLEGEEGLVEREKLSEARDAMLDLHQAYDEQMKDFAERKGDLAQKAAEALARAHETVVPTR